MIIFLGSNYNLYRDLINRSKPDADIVVSCQYPFRIPESLISSHACVNIHYGLLPYFAGCNPIYWQIKKSDVAGVTLHYVDKDFDTGDIIATDSIPIGGMNADEVFDALEVVGVELFRFYYKQILDGTAPRQKQDLTKRAYYPKTAVNFEYAKDLSGLNDKDVRALHFHGKQYPTIDVGGRKYELRSVNG